MGRSGVWAQAATRAKLLLFNLRIVGSEEEVSTDPFLARVTRLSVLPVGCPSAKDDIVHGSG